jgi:hypothetical protein
MIDAHLALQAMLQPTAASAALFPPTSRYHGIETAKRTDGSGKTIVFLRRRVIPSPDRFSQFQEHVVQQGERLDHIAANYLGDAVLFWQLCDANVCLHPDELTAKPGRRLRVTLPMGIPGVPND